MKLSTKGRYAMVALVDLALAGVGQRTSLAALSERPDISLPYLEQLLVPLLRAGLATPGAVPGGGHCPARAAAAMRPLAPP